MKAKAVAFLYEKKNLIFPNGFVIGNDFKVIFLLPHFAERPFFFSRN